MGTWQIWMSTAVEEDDESGDSYEYVSTASLYKKGEKLGDGTLMEDFDRALAEEDGGRHILMKEFDLTGWWFADAKPDVTGNPIEPEREVANMVYEAFLTAYWCDKVEEDEVD